MDVVIDGRRYTGPSDQRVFEGKGIAYVHVAND